MPYICTPCGKVRDPDAAEIQRPDRVGVPSDSTNNSIVLVCNDRKSIHMHTLSSLPPMVSFMASSTKYTPERCANVHSKEVDHGQHVD